MVKRVHFIAIGGSIMHQLAISLHLQGYKVSGSDDEIFDPAKSNLIQFGLYPEKLGWFSENINPSLDFIILGMHALANNIELLKAQELDLKIFSFPEFVFEHCQNKLRIAVAGSHGKTSTTGMMMELLSQAKINFDYVVGAKFKNFPFSVRLSKENNYLIAEADEYPDSKINITPKFHFLKPHIAIITGIAWDHINIFKTWQSYIEVFKIFILSIVDNGALIYNSEDETLNQLVNTLKPTLKINLIPYSATNYYFSDNKVYFNFANASFPVKFIGKHNVSNFNAAIEVAKLLKITNQTIIDSLISYSPPQNRLEKLELSKQHIIYRDFAHAPSKVKATIEAVRAIYKQQKILAIFELHTFSSLQEEFLPQYAHCFDYVDKLIIYFSKNTLKLKNLKLLDKNCIKKHLRHNEIVVIDQIDELTMTCQENSKHFNVFLFMSSGNYDNLNLNKIFIHES